MFKKENAKYTLLTPDNVNYKAHLPRNVLAHSVNIPTVPTIRTYKQRKLQPGDVLEKHIQTGKYLCVSCAAFVVLLLVSCAYVMYANKAYIKQFFTECVLHFSSVLANNTQTPIAAVFVTPTHSSPLSSNSTKYSELSSGFSLNDIYEE